MSQSKRRQQQHRLLSKAQKQVADAHNQAVDRARQLLADVDARVGEFELLARSASAGSGDIGEFYEKFHLVYDDLKAVADKLAEREKEEEAKAPNVDGNVDKNVDEKVDEQVDENALRMDWSRFVDFARCQPQLSDNKIGRPNLPSVGSRRRVTVCHVVHPTVYFVTDRTDNMCMELRLTSLYRSLSDEYRLLEAPQIGTVVAAKFASGHGDPAMFYRARVLDSSPASIVVFFVDFGNISRVSLNDLRQLDAVFCCVPALAFACGAANLAPVGDDGECRWPDEASVVQRLNGRADWHSLIVEPVETDARLQLLPCRIANAADGVESNALEAFLLESGGRLVGVEEAARYLLNCQLYAMPGVDD